MDKVLMVEDDVELAKMVAEYLGPEGFEVTMVHDGAKGLEAARGGGFAMVLLDVMLPELNGFDVLRRLRAGEGTAAKVPVVMLTARGQAVDRIVGLEVGADDYLAKPFDERELVARMRAILRRVGERGSEATTDEPARKAALRVGDVVVDEKARRAERGGEVVALTAVEFDMLVMLLRGAGGVVSREDLTREVLDRKLSSFDRSVDTHISRLRRKLGNHPNGEDRIKTVRSIGYVYTVTG